MKIIPPAISGNSVIASMIYIVEYCLKYCCIKHPVYPVQKYTERYKKKIKNTGKDIRIL